MSNLNVAKLKQLYPKNSRNRTPGSGRVRVQVVLHPDVLARLDELTGADGNARSAAVMLAVDLLCSVLEAGAGTQPLEAVARKLYLASAETGWTGENLRWIGSVVKELERTEP